MVIDLSAAPDEQMRMALGQLDTPSISDALDALQLAGGVGGLQSLTASHPICGRVRTVELVTEPPQSVATHLGARAVASAWPGEVIVVANRGRSQMAAWGGLLSHAAAQRDIAGVVIDGLCRDIEACVEAGMPIFARGATPASSRGRVWEGAHDAPVNIDSVCVHPGDWVVADRSGVVFIGARHVERVCRLAGQFKDFEDELSRRLSTGESAASVLDARYEWLTRRACE